MLSARSGRGGRRTGTELEAESGGLEPAPAAHGQKVSFFGRRRNRTAGQISFQSAKLYGLTGERSKVRVAGYSDYFCDLTRALQDEIIARTEHESFAPAREPAAVPAD